MATVKLYVLRRGKQYYKEMSSTLTPIFVDTLSKASFYEQSKLRDILHFANAIGCECLELDCTCRVIETAHGV